MLFSVVDDRSGGVYQEYRCVYGEDAESALRFLYNAMAAKPDEDMPFQGIAEAIYMDNGPVTRSRVDAIQSGPNSRSGLSQFGPGIAVNLRSTRR